VETSSCQLSLQSRDFPFARLSTREGRPSVSTYRQYLKTLPSEISNIFPSKQSQFMVSEQKRLLLLPLLLLAVTIYLRQQPRTPIFPSIHSCFHHAPNSYLSFVVIPKNTFLCVGSRSPKSQCYRPPHHHSYSTLPRPLPHARKLFK